MQAGPLKVETIFKVLGLVLDPLQDGWNISFRSPNVIALVQMMQILSNQLGRCPDLPGMSVPGWRGSHLKVPFDLLLELPASPHPESALKYFVSWRIAVSVDRAGKPRSGAEPDTGRRDAGKQPGPVPYKVDQDSDSEECQQPE